MKLLLALSIGLLLGYAIPDAIPAPEPVVHRIMIEMPTGRVLTPDEIAEGLCQYLAYTGETKTVTIYPGVSCVTIKRERP